MSVHSLSHVQLFATSWTAARQASLFITNSQSLPKITSTELVMPSNHLILCHPLPLRLQYFPASGSFQMSHFFASGGQSIGVSALASVLMNIRNWFPLGWTGWISLLSKEFSSLLQHHSSKASVLQHSAFFIVQLSHPFMTTGKPYLWLYRSSSAMQCFCFLIHCLDLSQLFYQRVSIF